MQKSLILTLLFLLLSVAEGFAQYTNLTDLPTIYINTFDGYSITSKDVYKYCKLHYVDEAGVVTSYDSVSIKGRGNSTWSQMAKKPYKIKFLTKEKFLGKGYAKAKKWTLLANAGDKTMIRNAVTSAMGTFCASLHDAQGKKSLPFSPASKFVDLKLNNVYVGTYQISDQVEVRPHRVNVMEQNYPLGESDDISGGYLMEVDGFKDGNFFYTSSYRAPVRIHYPDDEEISSTQNTYIRKHVNLFDQALSSTNFKDTTTGYRAYVDSASLIDWYICTEVSANIDGFYSTYFYKERADDHLRFGPLWDYDIAYNNDHRVRTEQGLSSSVNSMMVDIAYSGSREWVRRMWEDPWFQRTVAERYEELLAAGLVDYMYQKIDSLQTLLAQSQEMNYQKWGINKKMYHEMVLYSSYEQYIADLKTFISDHCAYLQKAFAERKPLDPTPPFVPEEYYYHLLNNKTQKTITATDAEVEQYGDDRENEFQDWQVKPVGSHFMLINRATQMALNDPTTGTSGPTVNIGAKLNVAEPDETDTHQLWNFLPQGNAGYYNLENVYSQHVANLEGGSASDGTKILSYTSNEKNSTSTNRLWRPVKTTALPEFTNIKNAEPENYALAYNPQTKKLHFGSDTPKQLTFVVRVYRINGELVGTFRANEQFDMGGQPKGVYVINWTVGGKERSLKFSVS